MFPILNPPPSSLPIPSLWVVPVHQPQASSIVHRTWIGNSFHTWYFTCFNAILPNLPTLSLSHRVHKTILYISVSFAVSYVWSSLLSLLVKMLIFSRDSLINTAGNNAVPAIWASFSPMRLTHKISHCKMIVQRWAKTRSRKKRRLSWRI